MAPVLFELFGVQIHAFGALVALAFLLGVGWAMWIAKQEGRDSETVLEAGFWIIIAAMVGARLTYVFFFPHLFFSDPIGVLFGQGGLVWYGGMGAAFLAVLIFARVKKLSIWELSDGYAAPVSLGLAIGRIGCLMAGCCYGAITQVPWAIAYPEGHPTHGVHVHPSPLYESLLMFAVAYGFHRYYPHRQYPGQLTWMFFTTYGAIRFLLEYYRGDRLVWLESLNLSASQVLSLAAMILGVVMLWFLSVRADVDKHRHVQNFHPDLRY